MIKTSLLGGTVSVLLAVSAISYSRTFQKPSKQGTQSQTQTQGKPDTSGSSSEAAPKQPDQQPAEAAGRGTAKEAKDLATSAGEGKEPSLPGGDSAKTSDQANLASENYVATAYSLRGRTASGRPVARGLIAADPAVLPLGSRVRLEAGSLSGEYLVADTGGAVKGRHVDIWTPTSREAMRFGKRPVKLTVLSYGPKRLASTVRRVRSHRH